MKNWVLVNGDGIIISEHSYSDCYPKSAVGLSIIAHAIEKHGANIRLFEECEIKVKVIVEPKC